MNVLFKILKILKTIMFYISIWLLFWIVPAAVLLFLFLIECGFDLFVWLLGDFGGFIYCCLVLGFIFSGPGCEPPKKSKLKQELGLPEDFEL